MRFLALSGSLRARSSNTELLRALARLAAPEHETSHYAGLAALPHFNPDLDREGSVPPAAVADLRRQVDRADALWISSPEYAHGVPGSLKNALDWLVSSPALLHKPVALLNASPRAAIAHAALAETLRTMSVVLVDEACLALDVARRDADAIASAPELADPLRRALRAVAAAVPAYRAQRAALGIADAAP